jgi:hypothetical protein
MKTTALTGIVGVCHRLNCDEDPKRILLVFWPGIKMNEASC